MRFLTLHFPVQRAGKVKPTEINPRYIVRMTEYSSEDGEHTTTKLTVAYEPTPIEVAESVEEIKAMIKNLYVD